VGPNRRSDDVAGKRAPPSDSDSAALDELVEESKFKARLKEHYRKRWETVRAWATGIVSLAAAVTLIIEWGSKAWHRFTSLFTP
jgi:hypothetical protein